MTGRFQCATCGGLFPPEGGGLCGDCRRVHCRRHLKWRFNAPICRTCWKQNGHESIVKKAFRRVLGNR